MELKLEFSDPLELHDSILYIKSTPGRSNRKFLLKGYAGDSFYHKEVKWCLKEQAVDREQDHYRKLVVDLKTGKVIRYCEEPLSQHHEH